MSKKFNAREVGMEKQCTHLMFTFGVVAYEFHTHSLLCISTNTSTRCFLTVQLSFPLKMPQEYRPLSRLFEKASCSTLGSCSRSKDVSNIYVDDFSSIQQTFEVIY